jgi:hypothetical protein
LDVTTTTSVIDGMWRRAGPGNPIL